MVFSGWALHVLNRADSGKRGNLITDLSLQWRVYETVKKGPWPNPKGVGF